MLEAAPAPLRPLLRRWKPFLFKAWTSSRNLLGHDRRIIRSYVERHPVRKLHIGCGQYLMEGWLNADIYPSWGAIHLDAGYPFPLPDRQFDDIFSEHMIEHISYAEGRRMLGECYRILKPGGTLRIATPDIHFLCRLLEPESLEPASDVERQYIAWALETHADPAASRRATTVVNNFMREWGHQFIYDPKTLIESFEQAGFTEIYQPETGKSRDGNLMNLENQRGMEPDFYALETFVVEGRKPLDAQD